MMIDKQIEVYNYVREHAVKYLSTIIQAINDGVVEENQKLQGI